MSLRDHTSELFLKQDRIARFAPEKQFSTTFRHNKPKQKRCESAVLHQWLRHVISVVLIGAALAAVILLLIGILRDHRPCLTAGCILGLACFGAMLHGCLRHRSLPGTPTPLVLSAAYMYPVGNLSLGSNHQDGAAATAMATATLLPKSYQPRSSLMASRLELAMLAQLQRDVSIAFPTGMSCATPHTMTRGSLFTDDPMVPPPSCYARQMSDSVAYTRSSGPSGDSSSGFATVPEFRGQISCPARTGGTMPKVHVYENLLQRTEWNPTRTETSGKIKPLGAERATAPGAAGFHSDSTRYNRDSYSALNKMQHHEAHSTIQTPQPGSDEFYKPPIFPVQDQIITDSSPIQSRPVTDLKTTSQRESAPSQQQQQQQQQQQKQPSLEPPVTSSHGNVQVRLMSPATKHVRTPRSILAGVRDPVLDSNISSGLIRLLSDSSAVNCGEVRQGRRHTREREGVFGPKAWRAWRSWVD